jgi:anti-sigma B factor antagonist
MPVLPAEENGSSAVQSTTWRFHLPISGAPGSDPASFRAELIVRGTTAIVELTGELDLAAAERAGEPLRKALMRGPERLVLDLAALTFMDATGVHLVIEAWKRSAVRGVQLVLVPGPRHVQRVFELCGLTQQLPFAGPPANGELRPSAGIVMSGHEVA